MVWRWTNVDGFVHPASRLQHCFDLSLWWFCLIKISTKQTHWPTEPPTGSRSVEPYGQGSSSMAWKIRNSPVRSGSNFDWRTPVLTHDHSLCSNRIGRNLKGSSGEKMRQHTLPETRLYQAHGVYIFVVCISRRECKEEGQSRWTRCLLNHFLPSQYFKKPSARLGWKPGDLGFGSLLKLLGVNFNNKFFVADVASTVTICLCV